MNKILWCPQHQITDPQMSELKNLIVDGEFVRLSDVRADLYEDLQNCSGDITDLELLADRLVLAIQDLSVSHVVLPIGSPAVMFLITKYLCASPKNITVMFAHSKRMSEEELRPDNSVIKRVVFVHEKFTEISI